MTGSCSGFDRLFVRARGTTGTGGGETGSGTTSSGSKKYIHLLGWVKESQWDVKGSCDRKVEYVLTGAHDDLLSWLYIPIVQEGIREGKKR